MLAQLAKWNSRKLGALTMGVIAGYLTVAKLEDRVVVGIIMGCLTLTVVTFIVCQARVDVTKAEYEADK